LHHDLSRDRSVPADMHDAGVDHACEVIASRWKRRRKLDPKLPETTRNHGGRLTGDDRFHGTISPQYTTASATRRSPDPRSPGPRSLSAAGLSARPVSRCYSFAWRRMISTRARLNRHDAGRHPQGLPTQQRPA
jgi:hypothetical protein